MKILLINKFLYHKGGDAVYTLNLGALLRSRGHEVIFWGMDHPFNPDYPHKDLFVPSVDYNEPDGIAARLKMAANILYSFEAKRKIETLVKIEMPDMVHLNNFAHQISPSILDVFKKYNIPVVMTMHDYKLVCASYLMYYDTKICEACRRNRHYNVFLKRCFKNSRLKSLIGTLEMYLHHKFS